MERDSTLEKLSDCTNRSYGQTLFLFELLDRDLKKLVLLEQKLKNNFVNYCPGDKEECEKVLGMGDGSGWCFVDEQYSHLDDFLDREDKIGKECTFTASGHKGIIKLELSHNKLFSASWGIYWYDGRNGKEHANINRKLGPLHFWHDKNLITFNR